MTYVIIHGNLNDIKFEINDGALTCFSISQVKESWDAWEFKERCIKKSEEVFKLGNYYSDDLIEGWEDEEDWTESRRQFVSDKWLELYSLIDRQIKDRDRIDLELLDFFTPNSSPSEYSNRIRALASKIDKGEVPAKVLVKIMESLEEVNL